MKLSLDEKIKYWSVRPSKQQLWPLPMTIKYHRSASSSLLSIPRIRNYSEKLTFHLSLPSITTALISSELSISSTYGKLSCLSYPSTNPYYYQSDANFLPLTTQDSYSSVIILSFRLAPQELLFFFFQDFSYTKDSFYPLKLLWLDLDFIQRDDVPPLLIILRTLLIQEIFLA